MTEDQIKHMTNRFLGWKLPEHFNPDNGISFDPVMNKGHQFESRREPVGTNLLDADQATAMVRYMAEGVPDEALAAHKTMLSESLLREGNLLNALHEIADLDKHGGYNTACDRARRAIKSNS